MTRVKKKPPRKRTPDEIEAEVLTRSLRRCTLCFHLKGNLKKKHGQVAHLNGDRSNYAIDNLAFMCLKHHTLFDSTTSQHKNYTLKEVKGARARLYAAISQGEHLAYKKGTAKPQPGREADAQTLEALIKLMASTGTIDWLRGANFAGWSFDWSRLEGIEAFFHQKGPEHEFIDTDLEALRKNFHAAVAKLLTLLATETYPVGSGNRQAIPEDWEDEQPERFQRAVKEAHETSDLVCKIYDDLVRAAKRRLSR